MYALVPKLSQLAPCLSRQTHSDTYKHIHAARKLTFASTHILSALHILSARYLCWVPILEDNWWVLPLLPPSPYLGASPCFHQNGKVTEATVAHLITIQKVKGPWPPPLTPPSLCCLALHVRASTCLCFSPRPVVASLSSLPGWALFPLRTESDPV